jgi:hypothetical protein
LATSSEVASVLLTSYMALSSLRDSIACVFTILELHLNQRGAAWAPCQAQCKKRAQIHSDFHNRQIEPLRDKRDKKMPDSIRFTYKNNIFSLQTSHFRPGAHGTNIANLVLSTTSPGTPHVGLQHQ